ncbi:MAG: HAD family hydrolase [Propionibacterium sp.]|nr:HAD family hydrolase [Propionibacterium sp.]
MVPALIATDLDGTLLDADARIPPRNSEALWRAHRLGVPIAITTGRPVRWLSGLDSIAGLQPHVICSNGSVRFDLASGTMAHRVEVPPETARSVAAELRDREPGITFAVEIGAGWGCEPGFPIRDGRVGPDVVAPIDELVGIGVVKLMALSVASSSDALAERLVPIIDGRLSATWSMGGARGLLEIGPPGVSKATALRDLCDELGLGLRDVVAFGDMPNDLDMLRAVGHPYAMANAHPLLLAEGFNLAPPHTDDGVGRILEALLDAADAHRPSLA